MWHPVATGQKSAASSVITFYSSFALTALIVGDMVYRKKQAGGELRIGGWKLLMFHIVQGHIFY